MKYRFLTKSAIGIAGLSLACFYGIKRIKSHNRSVKRSIENLKLKHADDRVINDFIHIMNRNIQKELAKHHSVNITLCLKQTTRVIDSSSSLAFNLRNMIANITSTYDYTGCFEHHIKLLSEQYHNPIFIAYMYQIKSIAIGAVPDNDALNNAQSQYNDYYHKYLKDLSNKKRQIINLAWDKSKFNLLRNYISNTYNDLLAKYQQKK